ncbi:MAG: hypothetical protein M3Q42_04695 [Pseudomonadota bacterium]|nr:hypothetical protein [Pseudomonadota bacterium]
MSTINHQCQYCYQTTSIEDIDNGKDEYDWVANGDCGCERQKAADYEIENDD